MVIVIQKTHSKTTTIKFDETGTIQCGGQNGKDKIPNILINEEHIHDIIRQGRDTYNESWGGGNSLTKKHSWDMIKVKSATKDGFEIAKEGDSINLSQPNSKTRRGRVGVGVGVGQTLDTQCNQAVIVASRGRGENNEQQLEPNTTNTTNTITGVQKDNLVMQLNPSKESNGTQPYQQNRVYAKEGIAPTIDQAAGRWSVNTTNIRRLTEIECERLQGFSDNWTKYGLYEPTKKELQKYFDKTHLSIEQVKNGDFTVFINKQGKQKIQPGTTVLVNGKMLMLRIISSTQRYKLCGNAVTRDVVELVANKLLKSLNSE